jgi:hypothetical protein
MPYSTTISALDFSNGVADIHVTAGYTFTEVGAIGPDEKKQDDVTMELWLLRSGLLGEEGPGA